MKKTISKLQAWLTAIFVAAMLTSNVISAKQIQLPFGITMTSAVIVFPITYILSDIFSEVYGYKWSRTTCYMAFGANLLMVCVFSLAICTPAPTYWGGQEAFKQVLGSTPRILGASLLGFVAGDFVNDRVFRAMKAKHSTDLKAFGWRAIISSFAGEACDSAIFIPLAFFGQMPIASMLTMAAVQILLKVGYEVVILPVTSMAVKKIWKIEGGEKNGGREAA